MSVSASLPRPEVPQPGGSGQRARVTDRVYLFDTARFVLIALVVIGHTISTVRNQTEFAYALYAGIYLFHMPAMIALSGVFSRQKSTNSALRSTVQLGVVWLLWEVIWAAIHWVLDGRDLPSTWLVTPAWTLWFLVTLATMRILLPYIAQLRHPLLVSIVVALIAGLSPAIGTEFSASRTLCFLPFFVAAWVAADRGITQNRRFVHPSRALRVVAWVVLACGVVIAGILALMRTSWRIDTWLTWRDGYEWLFQHAPIGEFSPTAWWAMALGGAGVRLLLLGVAAVLTVALLIVVPRSRSVLAVWGTRTLVVYLLHGPIVYALRETGVIELIAGWGVPGVTLLVAAAIGLTLVLSLELVTRMFARLTHPKLDWAFTGTPKFP